MKPMTCGSCHDQFKNHDVKESKFNFYGYDMRCPNCGTWLAPDSRSILLRLIGFALWIGGLGIVYLLSESDNQNGDLVVGVGFFALVGMALFAASYKASTLTPKKN